jgi:hypothetical protein
MQPKLRPDQPAFSDGAWQPGFLVGLSIGTIALFGIAAIAIVAARLIGQAGSALLVLFAAGICARSAMRLRPPADLVRCAPGRRFTTHAVKGRRTLPEGSAS